MGPWRAELERLLAANAARSSRERLTLMRIFEDLRGLGSELRNGRRGQASYTVGAGVYDASATIEQLEKISERISAWQRAVAKCWCTI